MWCGKSFPDDPSETKNSARMSRALVKETLTLQAGHVLNASWGYSAVHLATGRGSTHTHAGATSS